MNYAGIGSRQTPQDVLEVMRKSAYWLAKEGYTLNTGAAKGADQAFAEGASGHGLVNLFVPWMGYEQHWINSVQCSVIALANNDVAAFESVKRFHPAYTKLSQGAVKLHARNYLIVNGVMFIICWTPGGRTTGGTGQGILIAQSQGIPIYNLGNPDVLRNFITRIKEMECSYGQHNTDTQERIG